MGNKHKLTMNEIALLDAAVCDSTDVLPMRWWADFLTLFLGRTYSLPQARHVLNAYNARR